jgi:hypothetical protein
VVGAAAAVVGAAAAVVGAAAAVGAAAVGAVEDGAELPPQAANSAVIKPTNRTRLIFLNVSTRFMANSPLVQTKTPKNREPKNRRTEEPRTRR